MLTHGFWFLVCNAVAVYRLSILIIKDSITEPIREKIKVHSTNAFLFVTCPWCVSIWIAAGVVLLTRFIPGAWQYAALWLTLSGVTGFLAER